MQKLDLSSISLDLTKLAITSLLEREFLVDFPPPVQEEVNHLSGPANPTNLTQDLRHWLWFSIDNDDTKDFDQLTHAKRLNEQTVKIYIAIADVASLVYKNSAIDLYAQHNTTSIYTPTHVFPMLPEKLSTDLTSLTENTDRLALVADLTIGPLGKILDYTFYPAYVRNHARLTYYEVQNYLEGKSFLPERTASTPDLKEQIKLHDEVSHHLDYYRYKEGALSFETVELQFSLDQNAHQPFKLTLVHKNRARQIIENFMIAANTAAASFLRDHHYLSIRRVVKTPKRWERIVALAKEHGETLPDSPDSKALNSFLIKRRLLDPEQFPLLSVTVIKLLGSGEYVVEQPWKQNTDHFGLALRDYTHSTAPNRRFPDLITQRILKSILYNQAPPYTFEELDKLAQHCTKKENDAEKVERRMKKSASILFISTQINQEFDALVTGASIKGTWVRLTKYPIEGKLVQGFEGLDVGDKIRVKLIQVNMQKGFIDFVKV